MSAALRRGEYKLSPEVWRMIFVECALADESDSGDEDGQWDNIEGYCGARLYHVALVCRHWNAISTPLMYRRILCDETVLGPPLILGTLNGSAHMQQLCAHTRILDLRGEIKWGLDGYILPNLRFFTRLQELTADRYEFIAPALEALAVNCSHTLRHLNIVLNDHHFIDESFRHIGSLRELRTLSLRLPHQGPWLGRVISCPGWHFPELYELSLALGYYGANMLSQTYGTFFASCRFPHLELLRLPALQAGCEDAFRDFLIAHADAPLSHLDIRLDVKTRHLLEHTPWLHHLRIRKIVLPPVRRSRTMRQTKGIQTIQFLKDTFSRAARQPEMVTFRVFEPLYLLSGPGPWFLPDSKSFRTLQLECFEWNDPRMSQEEFEDWCFRAEYLETKGVDLLDRNYETQYQADDRTAWDSSREAGNDSDAYEGTASGSGEEEEEAEEMEMEEEDDEEEEDQEEDADEDEVGDGEDVGDQEDSEVVEDAEDVDDGVEVDEEDEDEDDEEQEQDERQSPSYYGTESPEEASEHSPPASDDAEPRASEDTTDNSQPDDAEHEPAPASDPIAENSSSPRQAPIVDLPGYAPRITHQLDGVDGRHRNIYKLTCCNASVGWPRLTQLPVSFSRSSAGESADS